jgi:hypothetical protein
MNSVFLFFKLNDDPMVWIHGGENITLDSVESIGPDRYGESKSTTTLIRTLVWERTPGQMHGYFKFNLGEITLLIWITDLHVELRRVISEPKRNTGLTPNISLGFVEHVSRPLILSDRRFPLTYQLYTVLTSLVSQSQINSEILQSFHTVRNAEFSPDALYFYSC